MLNIYISKHLRNFVRLLRTDVEIFELEYKYKEVGQGHFTIKHESSITISITYFDALNRKELCVFHSTLFSNNFQKLLQLC